MPYRVQSVTRRRGFYLLLVAGAVASFAALGLTIGGVLSHNTQQANRAVVSSAQTSRFAWEIHSEVVRLQSVETAVCSLRADLRSRVNSTARFLRSHPRGILGVPAATIRASLKSQRATLRSLRALRCHHARHARHQ